ncbi:MAG: hypothetical protein AAF500_04160 [Myxococcota bacterium]
MIPRYVLMVLVAVGMLLVPAASGAAPKDYPNCMADRVASIQKRNAEYQPTKADMAVVEPAEGRATIGPVKLDFCGRVPPLSQDCPPDKRGTMGRISRSVNSAGHSGFHTRGIHQILAGACDFQGDPAFEEAVGYAVQLWANDTGQSREDAIESIVLRADQERWKSGLEQGCQRLTVDEEASPEEETKVRAAREAVGCNAGGNISDIEWYIDTGDQPSSELLRLYYTLQCVRPFDGGFDANQKQQWVKIGVCGPDVRALDVAKVNQETSGMPAPLQANARENVAAVKARFADLDRVARPKADSDPDYKKLLYDAPQAGWDAWVAQYKKYKKAMDATYAFETDMFGPRVDTYKYCYKDLEPGVASFFKSSKFKNREQVVAAMKGPIGYTLMSSLGSCYAVTGPWDAGVALLNATKESRVWRGPRAAAGYAMVDAASDIAANRPRFPLDPKWFYPDLANYTVREARRGERSNVPNNGNFPDVAEGVIRTAKTWSKQKDATKVEFKTETWMEKVVMCQDTNKIDRIENGKVFYRKKCQSKGNQKKQFTPKTTLFWKWSTKGMKPNAFVVMEVPPGSEYGDRMRWGYPVEVYANKKKTKLVSMYGFPL